MAVGQLDAAHTGRAAPHGTDIALGEANRLAVARHQQNLGIAIGNRNVDQFILASQIDGNDAVRARAGKLAQRRLFDGSRRCRHEDEMTFRVFLDRQDRVDAFACLKRQEIHDGLAAGPATGLRYLVDLQPVDLAAA